MRTPERKPRSHFRQQTPPWHKRKDRESAGQRNSHSTESSDSAKEWRERPDLAIRVDNLPVGVSAEYLWRWFTSEGNIIRIEIFEPKNEQGTMSARVLFNPAPRCKFWQRGQIDVQHPDEKKYPEGLTVNVSHIKNKFRTRETEGVLEESKHPTNIVLMLDSLSFGSMLRPTLMRVLRTIDATDDPMSVELDVKKRCITVLFSHTNGGKEEYKVTTPFKVVVDMSMLKMTLETCENDGIQHLVLALPRPPEYFRKAGNILDTFQANTQTWYANDVWYRATDIIGEGDTPMNHSVALYHGAKTAGYIDVGRWTALRLSFKTDSSTTNSRSYSDLQRALAEFNVSMYPHCDFDARNELPTVWDYLDDPPTTQDNQPSALLLSQKIYLKFSVRYQLEVCISRHILNEYTIGMEFLHRLAGLTTSDATRRLEYLVDQDERLFEPMDLFEMKDAMADAKSATISHYCTYTRKATVTPTTILFNSPTVESSNRVVRKYSSMQDRFLRVQFLEESEFGRIGVNKHRNDEVWRRVERTLFQGIRIGDRVYEFLAFGSSQLRQNSAYFFCPTEHISCNDIRGWMGQFDHIKIVAKYAARLGQCFSTTREIRGVCMPKYIQDIERNGFCFTDGVGLISNFLAERIMTEMTVDVCDKPIAFQFRMGGCKGVLVTWPLAKGMEVHLRQSQKKFHADFKGLEIIRCATRSTATLNRQTITILESLGVQEGVFLKLLRDQIASFEKARHNNADAIDLLTKYVDENQSTLILAELLRAGFKSDELEEPFTANLLALWISWSIRQLKEKARILVPESAFVLGCVDETGTLRGHSVETEGTEEKNVDLLPQIFLQLTNPTCYNQPRIIQGICIVGRNPSLHPGDIRVVQAVDNPKLRHLRDVVVFPSTGDRPVPNMLSGGDLDGDDFFVIWDPDLIPSEWNHPPMNYSGPTAPELDRDVEVDDLREFFVNYMKNDNLGPIAVAHLACADAFGPKSQLCLQLANLHSEAVDYPKTGVPAEYGSTLNPKRWPHFMEKRLTYKSTKSLGRIYDEAVKHTVQFHPRWENAFDKRILEKYDDLGQYLSEAKSIKAQFDLCLRRLLVQHDVATEFELYSGWAMSRPRIGSDYKRQEDLGREFDALKQRFREKCYAAAGGSEPEHLDKFVASIYKVTEQEVKTALENVTNGSRDGELCDSAQPVPLISFPWIFHWVMIRLAKGNNYQPGKSILVAARQAPPLHRVNLCSNPISVISAEDPIDSHASNPTDARLRSVSIDGGGSQDPDVEKEASVMKPEGNDGCDDRIKEDDDTGSHRGLVEELRVETRVFDQFAALMGLDEE